MAEFRRWLEENGLREGQLFIDAARPGSSTIGRAGFQEMLKHFRSGLATEKGLAVWRSNRFGRNTNDSQFYKADIRRRGYIIHSLTDKIPQDRYGQIIEYLLDWKDQEFLETLSEDVSSGLRHIVETYGAIPGTPPRGFVREEINVGKRRNGQDHILAKWVPDPDYTSQVKTAYRMLINGSSLIDIKTATGLYGSLNSYVTFFRNPIYKGVMKYKDLIIEDYCEELVKKQEWGKAQIILEQRAGRRNLNESEKHPSRHPRRVNSQWLLSGIVRCARCGSPMVAHKIMDHSYYLCSRAHRRQDCDAVNVPLESLENEIVSQIRTLLDDPEALEAAQSKQLEQYKETVKEIPISRQDIVDRLENIRRQISRITDAVAENGHSSALMEKLIDLESQEKELKNELAQIDLLLQTKPEVLDHKRLKQLVEQFDEVFSSGSQIEKRQVLAGWIHHLEVDRIDKKRILVGLSVFIPPFDDTGTKGNVGLHLGAPKGTRTPVLALRGPRPGPLDDGGVLYSEIELGDICRRHGFQFKPIACENGALLYFRATRHSR